MPTGMREMSASSIRRATSGWRRNSTYWRRCASPENPDPAIVDNFTRESIDSRSCSDESAKTSSAFSSATPPRGPCGKCSPAIRASTPCSCTASRMRSGAPGLKWLARLTSHIGAVLHGRRDPSGGDHRPARVHRPRHGCRDRRDRGDRRRLHALSRRHAGPLCHCYLSRQSSVVSGQPGD